MSGQYHHRQRGTVMLIILPVAAAICALVGYLQPTSAGRAFALLLAIFFVVLTWFFSSLTVEVTEKDIRCHFGPGIWPHRIARADVEDARIVRGKWWHGFGIRMAPGYRLYNVSGLDAVELRLKSGGVRCIGTDDPQGLLSAVRS